MYSRILRVLLGCAELTINEETVKRVSCFIISSLIKNNLYSYGPHLEKIFHALLITDCEYKPESSDLRRISELIRHIIREEFMRIRADKRVLKLDRISDGMKRLFYENDGVLRMDKIYKFMPNLKELHLYESHDINDEFITKVVTYIKLHRDGPLNAIKAFKYCFKGSSQQFQFGAAISESNRTKLSALGWGIYEVHADNFYKFGLKKK